MIDLNNYRVGLPMIVGGAIIGFYLAFQQAGAGPYQWLLALAGILLGASCGVVVMVLQRKFHQASLQVIVSGIIGFVVGLGLSELLFSAISGFQNFIPSYIYMTMRIIITIGAAYLGAAIAIEKSPGFSMSNLVRLFREKEKPRGKSCKILDTSVIIDGRIADICETGFVEGTLLIPQFVLRELQQVADSSDPLKRNRGRRGL
ncbi:MAG: PIN domain nuclease, partial [Candidatus Methylomirabilis sp.]|nr:PIN domain nuclease [Candidatus Methylomirabilis sp.]